MLYNPPILGTVYKLVSDMTPKYYIGSTVQKLNIRLSQHKSAFKKNISGLSSKFVMCYPDVRIEPVVVFMITEHKQLLEKELEIINADKDFCFNILGTKDAYSKNYIKEYTKEYLKDPIHQEKHRDRNMKWRIKNKDRLHACNNTVVNCDHYDKT